MDRTHLGHAHWQAGNWLLCPSSSRATFSPSKLTASSGQTDSQTMPKLTHHHSSEPPGADCRQENIHSHRHIQEKNGTRQSSSLV